MAAALVLFCLPMGTAAAGDVWGGGWGNDGPKVAATRAQDLAAVTAGEVEGHEYVYAAASFCSSGGPGSDGADNLCTAAWLQCAGNPPAAGQGPAVKIYRREVDAAGEPVPPGAWEYRGTTCFPDLVSAPPMPTMDQIISAFHETDLALPAVDVQPAGNVTLVNLPTYFALVWPAAGTEPDEISATTIIGYHVEIRPKFVSAEYFFGDGRSIGPTESLGGPYPSGDIVARYDSAGSPEVRVDVTYGADFRISGGEWVEIPDTLTITGTPEVLQVREAKARLYTN